ncbi:MAG: cation diffusion facilitator family transporter, partial [Acidimicrobiales bacterium]
GKERFFYSMLAGVGIFVAGAGFSVIEGVLSLLHPESGSSDFLLKYLILGGSLVLEGTSWARAVHQVRAEARALGRTALEHVRKTSDPTVKTVATEDSAAIVGLVIAFVGIALHQATGRPIFDAIASLAIGALLVVVAVALVADNKDFLIGQAAEPETREAIRSKVEGYPEVTGVLELMTEVLGPTELLVAARVDFSDSLTAAQVEDLSSRIEEDLHHDFPHVTQVFLDATRGEALPEDH